MQLGVSSSNAQDNGFRIVGLTHTNYLTVIALHHVSASGTILWKLLGGQRNTEIGRRGVDWFPSSLLLRESFSTGFTSVHGERPSAEYAKLRKESLESEFGHALGTYSSKSVSAYFHFGPFLALYRAAIISFQVVKLTIWHFFVQDIHKRAIKGISHNRRSFSRTLAASQLVPPPMRLYHSLPHRPLLEDQIPPFPTHVAMKSIESQLGVPVSQVFADISSEPIAAASLGQVYKAHLHSGELVAVKVQRPGMSLSLTLDALLFHMIGGQLKRFAKARKDLLVAVNEMVRHMFEEIDYILEAHNAERFASLYACNQSNDQNRPRRTVGGSVENKKISCIKVPKIYWNLTRKTVLTMEWIDGIKLTDANRLKKACLNRKELIDQGLYCSLRQLLEVGFFHADPHPGNLVATDDGSLAYFDFGMMGDIPRHYRVGLMQVLVHFVNRDSLGLANDYLSLGFIPEGIDIQSVSHALQASFGDGTRQSQDFQGIMNQLYDVMYEFNFSLPPDYALVIRALGSLEGTAKALDPNFQVVESAYPFVIGRLLADPNPDMRKILRELVIRNNGSIRWNRLERLIAAISEQASESAEGSSNYPRANDSNVFGWKSFDMHAVVAATEDLFHFILSEKGHRVRVFLVRDIIKAADVFLQNDAAACIFYEKFVAKETPEAEGDAMLTRVLNGFRSIREAIKLAPEVWTVMLLRLALKPEVHRFSLGVASALVTHSCRKIPEASWICISRLLHELDTNIKLSPQGQLGGQWCLVIVRPGSGQFLDRINFPRAHKIVHIFNQKREIQARLISVQQHPPASPLAQVEEGDLQLGAWLMDGYRNTELHSSVDTITGSGISRTFKAIGHSNWTKSLLPISSLF
ncbi:hypothetical protein HHK36_013548 [Tetracentron sinense]|uniref:ABC1 atypical kinase-like domain-containing protein n=1 Tax=Tetracentron sinense TaxID=13715 RepID=A0A834ZAK1_TETSI|nr:hypothetical protein HHK36_013548 [Tetracentron sinense]